MSDGSRVNRLGIWRS